MIKPILFNTQMVMANLDNIKTATRRVAFPASDLRQFQRGNYPDGWWFRGRVYKTWDDAMRSPQGVMSLCRYHPGDILYVRETFFEHKGHYYYKADGKHEALDSLIGGSFFKWRPSIHMPKEAARLFLRVTNVRVERLQAITEEQAEAEGTPKAFEYNTPEGPVITLDEGGYFLPGFKAVWNSTIPKDKLPIYGWNANPWVWVIQFERISKEKALEGDSKA